METTPNLTSSPFAVPAPSRPGGLTALCVLAIVLGCLGGLTLLQSVIGLAVQVSGGASVAAGPGMTPELAEVQLEMEAATRAIARKFLPLTISALVLQVALCIGLIYGGIGTLRLREKGRRVLIWAFIAGLIIEPLRTLLNSFVAYESFTVMQPMMGRMMEAMSNEQQPMPPGVSSMMGQMMTVIGIVSIVGFIIWMLVKCGYFLWARSYLSRPEIVTLFR